MLKFKNILLKGAIIFLICNPVFSQKNLKNKIQALHNQKRFAESISYLEQYTQKKTYDLNMFLIYAKALLLREDLKITEKSINIHLYQEQKNKVIKNYKNSAKIFRETLIKLEKITPNKKKLGKWFFLMAMSEWFSLNRTKAIHSFQKAIRFDKSLNEANFNIGVLYEILNENEKAKFYFKKYVQNKSKK